MHQSVFWLFFLGLLFNSSLQTQLFRDLAGTTLQNFAAEANHWTLSDPLGLFYPSSFSTTKCLDEIILVKSDSYLPGTNLKTTFNNLEDHNILRFYVKIFYMGDYTTQTVNILFDDISIETSQLMPMFGSLPDACDSPYVLSGYIVYYGAVPHTANNVTVEFVSNLHGAFMDVSWGIRDLSLVADTDLTITSPSIYGLSDYALVTVPTSPCPSSSFPTDMMGLTLCMPCPVPCKGCFGMDATSQCFTYLPGTPENRLCPYGKTYLNDGCMNCTIEGCQSCDQDVNQCDVNNCDGNCAQCDNSGMQCLQCTVESGFVLYQGACIDNWTQGTYADSNNICQSCQIPGCVNCSGPDVCLQCANDTTKEDNTCVCNQSGTYFEDSSGACTGTCPLGCDKCTSSNTCSTCYSGLTLQSDESCRCDNNGFYYQNETGSCTGQCPDFCDYCLDKTSCMTCQPTRVPQDGICKCQSPRILVGTNCECPSFMIEDLLSLSCVVIRVGDIIYQSVISPLYNGIIQARLDLALKWSDPPSLTWTVSCNFQDPNTQSDFLSYVSTQNTDLLLLPSRFLEYNLRCFASASYLSGMVQQLLPLFSFSTVSPAQPQLQIIGGPLQMVSNSEESFIFAEVRSSIGSKISASDLKITWTQTSGDHIDMSSIIDSSNPLQLTIPKCTLEKGKVYKFKLDVQLLVNIGSEAWQEVILGVYAPKFQAQITRLDGVNYHLSSESLSLGSQLSLSDDECPQTTSISDLLDLSTALYTWECFYLDLQLSSGRLLNDDESQLVTNDSDVHPHPDPDNLFDQASSSSTLTIPDFYFTDYPGYQFMFYLTVTVQSKDQTESMDTSTVMQKTLETLKAKSNVAIVSSIPFTTASFTCMSENNCQAYSKDFPARFVGSSFNHQYSYKWLLNTLQSVQYTTFIRVFDYNRIEDWTVVPRILYTITDGTNTASAFFTLPLNLPPQSGYISIYPLIGEAYNTKFSLSTYGWTDTDLPVYYEFYTTFDATEVYPSLNLMIKSLNPSDETILVPAPYLSKAYVGVIVHDNLKETSNSASAVIYLSGSPQTLCDAVSQGSAALISSQQSDNLYQRFRLVSVMMELVENWESNGSDGSACLSDNYDFKFAAITEINSIVQTLNRKHEFQMQLMRNVIWTANPEFNQNKNWNLYTTIIDSYYLPNISKAIFSAEEYSLLMTWTDYEIWFMKKPSSNYQDPAKIDTYLRALLRSTLTNALPVDESISYSGGFMNYFTYKTTYCKVLQEYPYIYYGLYGLTANVTLRPGQEIPPEKCNDSIDMVFLAFRSNYEVDPNADGESMFQNIVYFDLYDSVTGKSLLDIFTYLLLSPISICPDGYFCEPAGGGGTQIYGIFDLRDQVNKIFAKSNIGQIQNISALANFKFWKSVAFWTVVAFSTWFLLSFYWLYAKHPTYCALTAKKNTIDKAPLLKKIHLFFWVIHPLVGIYVYNDNKTSKPIKLAIYYQRLVLVMVFSTIFSSLDTGEGWVFKGYILLFNTVTVTPVNAVLGRIFEWAFKTDKKKKKITSTISLFLGIFCYLVLVVACFLVMFIVEAQQNASQNKTWAFNFIISFVQDLSLSPALSAVNKVLLIKFSVTERVAKKIKSPNVKNLILSDDFKSIYDKIFTTATTLPTIPTVKDSVKDGGLSPRSTIMSPISSTRKFLKFTTIDLQSPQTTKNNTQFDFRTRIASENEIGSVDLVPMETLISNRFQTLFPEAKAETVPTSPTKQNFEKMQATNIYSKSSLTNFPTFATTLKGSVLKQSKPFQAIEFNVKEPVEMTLDDIFQFAEQPDEGEEIPHASQLKLWKNNSKTIESPIREKRNTLAPSYLPSGELSLEQRISEKNSMALKKKAQFNKQLQFLEMSSINQFKDLSGLHPDEFSSFDGNAEEIYPSQLKLRKNNSKTTESPIRDNKNTLAPSYLPSVDLSLERGLSDKTSALVKKKGQLKQGEVTLTKPFQLMDLGSMNQFKEPSAIHLNELSSFDGNPEENFASQLKLLKNNSKATESPTREKRKDLTKSAPKITIGDFSSGDLPSVPKKMAQKFKYNETTPHKQTPSMEVNSVLEFKEPPDEFSSFDENTEEAVVSLPKFKTAESIMNKKGENSI